MSVRKIDLVATYEDFFNIPENERMTMYFGDYGIHVRKGDYQGFNCDIFNQRFNDALKCIGLNEQEYLNNQDFIYRGNIIKLFKTKAVI